MHWKSDRKFQYSKRNSNQFKMKAIKKDFWLPIWSVTTGGQRSENLNKHKRLFWFIFENHIMPCLTPPPLEFFTVFTWTAVNINLVVDWHVFYKYFYNLAIVSTTDNTNIVDLLPSSQKLKRMTCKKKLSASKSSNKEVIWLHD